MTRLTEQYPEFAEWLRENVNDDCREWLFEMGDRPSNQGMAAWLEQVDDEGHIEIRSSESRTGRPVTGSFPELCEGEL